MKTVFIFLMEELFSAQCSNQFFSLIFFNASLQQITMVLLQCFPKRVPENSVFSPQVQNKNVLHLCPS